MLGSSQSLRSRLSAFGRARRGAAAAEFGITIMLLLIMVVAVIEMGRLYQAYHLSDKALRDAARYLAQQNITCPAGGGVGTIVNSSYEDAAKYIALTGEIDPQYLPGGTGTLPASPPASELLLGYWSAPSSITVTYNCIDKVNAAVTGGEFSGAYASEPSIPVVQMSADVPFSPMIDLWSMGGFTVTHNQVGIGDQS